MRSIVLLHILSCIFISFIFFFVNDHVAPDNEVIFLVKIICNTSEYLRARAEISLIGKATQGVNL